MQLSIFSAGVNRILLKKIPIFPIGNFNIFLLLLVVVIVFSTPTIECMRGVHPLSLKRNIAPLERIHSNFTEQIPSSMKKLRKLPHVFNTVLELPFPSDADVAVEEKEEYFSFVAKIELEGSGDEKVRAHAVEIHPGVTKIIVIKGSGESDDDEINNFLLEQLNVDTWRYRLPPSTIPELATAAFVDGDLIVTVPKSGRGHGEFDDGIWIQG